MERIKKFNKHWGWEQGGDSLRPKRTSSVKQILYKTMYPVDIYLFKVSYGNTRTINELCSKFTIKNQNYVIGVDLVTLFLALNRFHTLFWCFHHWLLTSKCLPCITVKSQKLDWNSLYLFLLILTYLLPILIPYIPSNNHKTVGFLMFLVDIEM